MSKPKLCEQCGREPAAVYATAKNGDAKRQQALCLRCAQKQKIPAVTEYLKEQKRSAAEHRMCEQCGEQPATVFVTALKDGEKPGKQSLCAFCAGAQGIQPVTDLNLSDAELREIHAEILNRMQEQKSGGFRQKLRRIFRKS